MKQVTCAILYFFGVSLVSAAKQRDLPANCRQCLVVLTDSWPATSGTMWLFDRNDNSPGRQRQSQIPVLVGRAGLGWGRGTGSCVFLHIWEKSGTSTSGCTAMSEKDLIDLIHWLDPARHPLLVQMPRSPCNILHSKWNLPGGVTF